jgi:hypothetical protein
LSERMSGGFGLPTRWKFGTPRRLGEILFKCYLTVKRGGVSERRTYFPLCPKLKSLLRYEACAEAKKIAAASDDRGAAQYMAAL